MATSLCCPVPKILIYIHAHFQPRSVNDFIFIDEVVFGSIAGSLAMNRTKPDWLESKSGKGKGGKSSKKSKKSAACTAKYDFGCNAVPCCTGLACDTGDDQCYLNLN